MIDETIARIEARLKSAEALSEESRKELQALLSTLKAELLALSQHDADQARTIAGYVELSTHEATREQKQPRLLEHAIDGLKTSVYGLEAKHPRLTELANSIGLLLSNTGL
jgi:hypothetical protein